MKFVCVGVVFCMCFQNLCEFGCVFPIFKLFFVLGVVIVVVVYFSFGKPPLILLSHIISQL